MTRERESWTLSDEARASNPGRLPVNRLQWLTHYPRWPIVWAVGFLASCALGWFLHWSLWISAALFLAMNLLYWTRVSEHFDRGCANPGVVVSLDPMLIAVSTDLSKGDGVYRAIKIIHKELRRSESRSARVGTRVPTVALYEAGDDESTPHWKDFDPRPAECATTHWKEVERILSSFDEDDWSDLENGISEVPLPYRPGLYFVSR